MSAHHVGTNDMTYLDTPIPLKVLGHDGIALVVDANRVFARWFDGRVTHLAWVPNKAIPRQVRGR